MTENGEIVYQFYRKPIANKHTVMKTSGMDKHQKMRTLSQECFRRLHNTSKNISEDVILGLIIGF